MIIRTEKKSARNGAGNILAKGGGRQKTTRWDHSKSPARNHGEAAGNLALILGLSWHDGIGHDSNDAGNKHGFSF